jgi:hypothetical protein
VCKEKRGMLGSGVEMRWKEKRVMGGECCTLEGSWFYMSKMAVTKAVYNLLTAFQELFIE